MKPYDDETMTYDFDEHRYILTEKYVEDKTGINLSQVLNPAFSNQPQKLGEQFLDQVSEEIYTWIYDHNADNDVQEFFLAMNEQLRKILRKAMLEQVLYVLKSGDMFMYCGVNLKNGVVIDEHKIVQNAISPLAQMKLSKKVDEIGTSIIYQGKFRYPFIKFKGEY